MLFPYELQKERKAQIYQFFCSYFILLLHLVCKSTHVFFNLEVSNSSLILKWQNGHLTSCQKNMLQRKIHNKTRDTIIIHFWSNLWNKKILIRYSDYSIGPVSFLVRKIGNLVWCMLGDCIYYRCYYFNGSFLVLSTVPQVSKLSRHPIANHSLSQGRTKMKQWNINNGHVCTCNRWVIPSRGFTFSGSIINWILMR